MSYPYCAISTGASSERVKTDKCVEPSADPWWRNEVVVVKRVNPQEACTIEILQEKRVFHVQTLAKFMIDLAPLKSGEEYDLWLEAVGGYMSVEEERLLRKAEELFNSIDKDGNGLLDMDEVRALFESMEFELTDEQHAKAFREMDDDGNGEVDFDEFHAWYISKQEKLEKIWQPRVTPVFTVLGLEAGEAEPWVLVDIELPAWAQQRKAAAALEAARKLTADEERAEAKELFDEIDLDDSGYLDAMEIRNLAGAMGSSMSDSQVAVAMRDMNAVADEDGTLGVGFEDFFLWWQAYKSTTGGIKGKMLSKLKIQSRKLKRLSIGPAVGSPSQGGPPSSETPSQRRPEEEVRRFFDEVDSNGDGVLDRDEVQQLSRSLGTALSGSDLDEAMKSINPDGDGVTFDQFIRWFYAEAARGGSGGLFTRGLRSFMRSPLRSRTEATNNEPPAPAPAPAPRVDPALTLRLEREQQRAEQTSNADEDFRTALDLFGERDLDGARLHFQKTIDHGDSEHRVRSHNGIGMCLAIAAQGKSWQDEQGILKDAVACFESALELEPENKHAAHNQEEALRRLGDIAKLEVAHKQAEKADAALEDALNLYNQNDYERAKKRFQTAIDLGEEMPSAWEHFARSHNGIGLCLSMTAKNLEDEERAKRLEHDALASFQTALKLEPNHGHAAHNRAMTLKKLGKKARAAVAQRREDERAATENPAANEAFEVAMDLFAEEQWEQAKAGFESAIEQGDMRVSRCYNGIGLCRYFDGKYELALEHFKKALTEDPHNASAQINRAKALEQLGLQGTEAGEDRG